LLRCHQETGTAESVETIKSLQKFLPGSLVVFRKICIAQSTQQTKQRIQIGVSIEMRGPRATIRMSRDESIQALFIRLEESL
jgi:hypothetical protein